MLTLIISVLLALTPGAAGMQREKGKALFRQGKLPEAIERFRAAVRLDPDDSVAWYNLAYATRKAQKFAQAAEAYQRYTALAPDDPDGYFGLGESLRQSGKPADAIAAYRSYVEKEKRPSEERWVQRARQHVAELEAPLPAAQPVPPAALVAPPTAEAASPAAQAAPPAAPAAPPPQANAELPIARGDKAAAAKDWRAALFAYQDAILVAPKNVEARLKAAQTYARMGHDDEALAQWHTALQLDPQNLSAREGMAAVRERRSVLGPPLLSPRPPPPPPAPPRVDEPSARAHYTRGVDLIHERKYDEAAVELDQSLRLKPGFAVALVARGSARVGQGRYPEAVADYAAAQQSDPALAAPLFGLAEAYRALGQTDKAVSFYREFAASTALDAEPALKDYARQNAQALAPK